MKIYEIVTPVVAPIKPGTPQPAATTPAPGTPPAATTPAPGTTPPPIKPGTPAPTVTTGQPVKPGVPPPAVPGQPVAPTPPSPKIQQDMKSMSDQFTALKLKYDQLQKQILTPQA